MGDPLFEPPALFSYHSVSFFLLPDFSSNVHTDSHAWLCRFQFCLPASIYPLLTQLSLESSKTTSLTTSGPLLNLSSRALDSLDHPVLKFHIRNDLIIPLPYFCQLYHFPKPFRKETLNWRLAPLPFLPSSTLVFDSHCKYEKLIEASSLEKFYQNIEECVGG